MNVNFFFRSSASSRMLSSCFRRSSYAGVVVMICSFFPCCCFSSVIYFSSSSIFLCYFASSVLHSSSSFYSTFFRYSYSSVRGISPFLMRVMLPWASTVYCFTLMFASSSLSFREASSDCWSCFSIVVSLSSTFAIVFWCVVLLVWLVLSM
jgi:hypothetical protein